MDNFVGIVETPCGTTVEILPKHHDTGSPEETSRALLARMIQAALDLPVRQTGPADITLFQSPLSEWVRRQFLQVLERLLKRGIKFDYMRVEEEQRYLRGQLDAVKQLRQAPVRRHYFHTRHDVFSLDFPENRLIKSALSRVAQTTQEPTNWRLARELMQVLAEVPASRTISQDFKAWRDGRLLAHYAPILPWCKLVLSQQLPMALHGDWHGMSMLFPMEKLFERFVEAALRRDLRRTARLTSQANSTHLCEHQGKGLFQLRPDLLVEYAGRRIVLDAKWKRLDQRARDKKYGMSQSDVYQLFAYGHKYINGDQRDKELVLIYPESTTFFRPLAPFSFDANMTLWVLPFHLGDAVGEEHVVLSDQMQLARICKGSEALPN
jgi:5-methylcytosine-specific restriction enzyme subunit McrC